MFDFLQVLQCRYCSCWARAGMFLMARHVFLVVCLGMVKFCSGLLVSSDRVITACGTSGMRGRDVVFDFLQVLQCRFCSCWAGAGMFLMARHVFLVVCFGMVQFCAGLLVSSGRVIPACGISSIRV